MGSLHKIEIRIWNAENSQILAKNELTEKTFMLRYLKNSYRIAIFGRDLTGMRKLSEIGGSCD